MSATAASISVRLSATLLKATLILRVQRQNDPYRILPAKDRYCRYGGMASSAAAFAPQVDDARCNRTIATKAREDRRCRHVHRATTRASDAHVCTISRPLGKRLVGRFNRRPFTYNGDTSSYRPALRSCRTIPLNAAVTPWALPISFGCEAASQ